MFKSWLLLVGNNSVPQQLRKIFALNVCVFFPMLVCCIFVFAHYISLLGFHGQAGLAADPLVHVKDGGVPRAWLHVVVFWTLPVVGCLSQ